MKFSIKDFLSHLVISTEEILNGKLHFLLSAGWVYYIGGVLLKCGVGY